MAKSCAISSIGPFPILFLLVALASDFSSAQQLRWSDEFVPTTRTGYINGGINTWNWNFHLGDGSDFGIPGKLQHWSPPRRPSTFMQQPQCACQP